MSNLVLLPRYSRRILRVALISALCVVSCIRLGRVDLMSSTFAVFSCSINYWRHPDRRSMRRKLDMLVAGGSVGYHLYCALVESANGVLYCVLVAVCIFCYWKARRIGQNDQDTSSRWHCAMHLCGNVANQAMYVGLPIVEHSSEGAGSASSTEIGVVCLVLLLLGCCSLGHAALVEVHGLRR